MNVYPHEHECKMEDMDERGLGRDKKSFFLVRATPSSRPNPFSYKTHVPFSVCDFRVKQSTDQVKTVTRDRIDCLGIFTSNIQLSASV